MDYAKVMILDLEDYHLTDVEGLEKLTKLKELRLEFNRDLTKAQIGQLKKALPKCRIEHTAEKYPRIHP